LEEAGLTGDVGYKRDGRARSGMGVDAADFNDDGWVDLFVAKQSTRKFFPSTKITAMKRSLTGPCPRASAWPHAG